MSDQAAAQSALQSAPHPSELPEGHQFDFWLGDWEVTWGDDQHGTNHVTAIMDHAVILENFDGRPGTPLIGMSTSVYNVQTRQWQQTWVDNQGNYLDFVGGFADGRMILSRHAHLNGRSFLQRMVWYDITPDRLEWNWERSLDDGQTWQVMWAIHYARSTRSTRSAA